MCRKALKKLMLRTRFFNASLLNIFHIKNNQLIIPYLSPVDRQRGYCFSVVHPSVRSPSTLISVWPCPERNSYIYQWISKYLAPSCAISKIFPRSRSHIKVKLVKLELQPSLQNTYQKSVPLKCFLEKGLPGRKFHFSKITF